MFNSYNPEVSLQQFKKYGKELAQEKKVDSSQIEKLGINILMDKYCCNEFSETSIEECFARVALTFSEDYESARKLYKYLVNLDFIPATPINANGGCLSRGMPISCFLNESGSNLNSMLQNINENATISRYWGGIGTLLDDLSVKELIPYCKMLESCNLAFYNYDRKSSCAVYLSISHGAIEEFLEMRRPTGGDPNMKCLQLHHGVVIPDAFFEAMRKNQSWNLYDNDGTLVRSVDPIELFKKIVRMRMETGEPYFLFSDRLKDATPDFHKRQGLFPKTSNLCSEITLFTNEERTAVCCLGSVNLDRYDYWKDDEEFIPIVMKTLDNVLAYTKYFYKDVLPRAIHSIDMENSVGLGVMGFHSLLQQRNIPMESPEAKDLNETIFKNLNDNVKKASKQLAELRGACKDAQNVGVYDVRFSYDMAIAPTATISYVGNCSPGIEPYINNSPLIKNSMGTYTIYNKYMMNLLQKNENFKYNDRFRHEVLKNVMKNEGSLHDLDFLDQRTKDVFKTAFQIPQHRLIELAADRQKYISQAQSLNLFLHNDTELLDAMKLHIKAHSLGLKSLYYCRTTAKYRAESVFADYESEEKKQVSKNEESNITQDGNLQATNNTCNFNTVEIVCEGCI